MSNPPPWQAASMPRAPAASSSGVSPMVEMPSMSAGRSPASAMAARAAAAVSSIPAMPVRRPIGEMPAPVMRRPVRARVKYCHDLTIQSAELCAGMTETTRAPVPAAHHRGQPGVLDRWSAAAAPDLVVRGVRALGSSAARGLPGLRRPARAAGGERPGHGVHVHRQPPPVQPGRAGAVRRRDRGTRGTGRAAVHDQHRRLRSRGGPDRDAGEVDFEPAGEAWAPVFRPAAPDGSGEAT